MFGMERFGKPASDNSRPASASPSLMILVSREDIFRYTAAGEAILLLRKNQEVQPDDLPKLIQHGARPEQFRFQYIERPAPVGRSEHGPEFQRNHAPEPMSNPITAAPRPVVNGEHARKKVLILEPEQKNLKRLIDCLFVCGFDLNRIHPLRISNHLAWALERHQPDILIVDYHMQDGGGGVSLLNALHKPPGMEQMILTLDTSRPLPLAEEVAIRKLCDEKAIKILYKPVNRFSLKQLLQEQEISPLMLIAR